MVWLVVRNAGTERVARILEQQQHVIEKFVADPEVSLLILRFGRSL